MSKRALETDAAFLIGLAQAEARAVFFDEDDQTVHEFEDGVLLITTNFSDYTTYKLTPVAASSPTRFDILVENEDGVAEFDDDAETDLAQRLARLVEQARQFQNKRELTTDELTTLAASLIPAGEWEWKEWPEIGTGELQDASEEYELGISIVAPTLDQEPVVYQSDDFMDGVLDWFRQQLNPQCWTLIAVSPFDELQSFFLVRSDQLQMVRELLYQQGRRVF